ncbi:MAG: leucyl aminopeptidase [Candidatus Eisenbacteria bacterium]|nr:leucyl aminopeptidase [Candidatus Eisenbacteria bacterium]
MAASNIRQLGVSVIPVEKDRADLLVIALPAGSRALPAAYSGVLGGDKGPVAALLGSGDFKGECGEAAMVYGASENYARVLLIGTGEAKAWTRERARAAIATAARRARDLAVNETRLVLPLVQGSDRSSEAELAAEVELAAEAALLGAYQYTGWKTVDLEKFKTAGNLTFVCAGGDAASLGRALERGRVRGEAVNFVRDLGNTPANHLTPTQLADKARDLAKQDGLKVRILDREACEKEGFGSFLSVAQGSAEPPQFIVLEYDCGRKDAPLIGLIGKGITFDSGGISIKPAAAMHEMKFDMCGAAAVLGTMKALKGLAVPVNVVAAIPATENMPGGRATKPGDVFTSYSGKTIEVQNTDAEGRLVLADALTWVARTYKPTAMLDFATLTGAVVIALGHYGAAILSNNDGLAARIAQASETSGDKSWRLPLWEDYPEHIKSDCADLKNIADGNAGGGTIAGGAFLAQFVDDVPWAHVDIAGTAWWDRDRPHLPKGPSGYGVRLLLDLLEGYGR